jgi:hypothetical protein
MHIRKDTWQGKPLLRKIGPKPTQEMWLLRVIWVLAHVPSIHDFDSITLLFFDHMPDTGVSENMRVTLSKSQIEDTLEKTR